MSDAESRKRVIEVAELWGRLSALEDGDLSPVERDELMTLLDESRASRRLYSEYFAHSVALEAMAKFLDQQGRLPVLEDSLRTRRIFQRSLLAAAAVVALVAAVMSLILTRTPPPTLRIATSPGTVLEVSHQLTGEDAPEGQVMEPGSRLQLQRGTVELAFSSGMRGIVHAPADLTLRDENLLELDHGTAWFEVPSKAVGFQVNTPDLLLIDLGTEFGIRSRPDFLDEVHVFTGKVEVRNRHGLRKGELLVAGQARVAGPTGRWQETSLRRDHFLTELPTTGPGLTVLFTDSFEGAKSLTDWLFGGVPAPPGSPVPGGSTFSVPGPWMKDGDFGSGWVEPGQYTDPMPDGDIYVWTNGPGRLSHSLSDTLQPNTTYTLTVATGWRADLATGRFPTYPGYGIELLAGDTLLASDYDKSHGGTGTGPAAGTWKDATATYTTGSSVSPGQQLEVRLIGYGGQTNYDHVRLEATPVR